MRLPALIAALALAACTQEAVGPQPAAQVERKPRPPGPPQTAAQPESPPAPPAPPPPPDFRREREASHGWAPAEQANAGRTDVVIPGPAPARGAGIGANPEPDFREQRARIDNASVAKQPGCRMPQTIQVIKNTATKKGP